MRKNKIIKEFNKFKINTDMTDSELLEMANLDSVDTGIDKVIIWVGPPPANHGHRIKVSNIPNKFRGDCFSLTLPDFRPIGKINKSFITPSVLNRIKEWVRLNYDTIIAFSEEKIPTRELIRKIKPLPHEE